MSETQIPTRPPSRAAVTLPANTIAPRTSAMAPLDAIAHATEKSPRLGLHLSAAEDLAAAAAHLVERRGLAASAPSTRNIDLAARLQLLGVRGESARIHMVFMVLAPAHPELTNAGAHAVANAFVKANSGPRMVPGLDAAARSFTTQGAATFQQRVIDAFAQFGLGPDVATAYLAAAR